MACFILGVDLLCAGSAAARLAPRSHRRRLSASDGPGSPSSGPLPAACAADSPLTLTQTRASLRLLSAAVHESLNSLTHGRNLHHTRTPLCCAASSPLQRLPAPTTRLFERASPVTLCAVYDAHSISQPCAAEHSLSRPQLVLNTVFDQGT